ncbi:MAG: 4-(cytidine 5'-diphospho)-2-C-methyl-D-erythritol kinase [Candidatus Omnitrophota bacterium]
MIIQSYAKVNLFLNVLKKRSDNYHNVDTLFERIGLSDKITLIPRRDRRIRVACSHPAVPSGPSNLCFKAAKLLRDSYGVKKGVDISIVKRIPVAAGLGGGSSNAACVLAGLNKLWGLGLGRDKLAELASGIGSDVVFFIYDAPFARGRGRGEKIRVLVPLRKQRLWHLLVVPKIAVSTPQIYRKFDELCGLYNCATGLTKPPSNVKILTSVLAKKNPIFKSGLLFNSLEQVTLKLYPEVRRVKERLAALGLKDVLMSGSGPSVFALVPSRQKAAALARNLKREPCPWSVFAVSTA